MAAVRREPHRTAAAFLVEGIDNWSAFKDGSVALGEHSQILAQLMPAHE
jgi:hypothetical protein